MHGDHWDDPYFWMRHRNDPKVIAYLKSENEYREQMMAHTVPLQHQLFLEMKGRIKETDVSVPEKRDNFYYYSRTEEGKQYPIYCRKTGSLDAPEEVLLDQNVLAEGQPFCIIGIFRMSPDHKLLAYSVDTSGAEQYTIYIKNLETGELLSDYVPNTYYSFEWANDNATFFYNMLDAAHRPYKLFRHTLGSNASQDQLIYHETDERFFLSLRKTKSRAYLFMELHSTNTTETRYLSADQPMGEFKILQTRRPEVEYSVAHHGERFLIVTNDQAQNFKLMEAPLDKPGKDNWREVIAHRSEVLIDGIDAFKDYLVVFERRSGLRHIRLSSIDNRNVHYVAFPEPVYTYTAHANPEFDAQTLRITYSSLVTPDTVVDIDMQNGEWEVKKRKEIPSGYDPSMYASERIMAVAADGAHVPISLVYKKGIKLDGSNPLLLHAYGSYGACIDPEFQTKYFSLLDRGMIFAIAHIRGGSDLGRAWYDNGKLRKKKNTFSDFIASTEHLIAQGYTSKEKLAIIGVSAGGLLMGAVVTMRPDLFKAVVAKVPFVDVLSTMSDPSIPLTVIEFEQWGNPANKDDYIYMKSYSPYDNIKTTDYPHMLVTAGLNDPRVAYWEPAKWVAKLRTMKTDNNRLLLKTNMDAGHAGSSGRYDYLKEIALEYAFVLDILGVERN